MKKIAKVSVVVIIFTLLVVTLSFSQYLSPNISAPPYVLRPKNIAAKLPLELTKHPHTIGNLPVGKSGYATESAMVVAADGSCFLKENFIIEVGSLNDDGWIKVERTKDGYVVHAMAGKVSWQPSSTSPATFSQERKMIPVFKIVVHSKGTGASIGGVGANK